MQLDLVKFSDECSILHEITFGLAVAPESYGSVDAPPNHNTDNPVCKLVSEPGEVNFRAEMLLGNSWYVYNQVLANLREYYQIAED